MATETKITPPYLPLATLTGVLQHLAETATPSKLDRGILSKHAGGTQSAILTAMKFLKFIADDGTTLPALEEIVTAMRDGDAAKAKKLVGAAVSAEFAPLLPGVNLERDSYKQLADAFTKAGVQAGDMVEKTARFYWTAMQDAGVKVSPHIVNAKNRGKQAGKKPTAPKVPAVPADDDNGGVPDVKRTSVTPAGYIDQLVPMRGRAEPAIIRYPDNLTQAEFKQLAHALEAVRLFALPEQEEGAAG